MAVDANKTNGTFFALRTVIYFVRAAYPRFMRTLLFL